MKKFKWPYKERDLIRGIIERNCCCDVQKGMVHSTYESVEKAMIEYYKKKSDVCIFFKWK